MDQQLVLLLIPLIVVELGLLVLALWDLLKPDRHVRGDSKLVWGLIIVFVGVIGPLAYFLAGRRDE